MPQYGQLNPNDEQFAQLGGKWLVIAADSGSEINLSSCEGWTRDSHIIHVALKS